MSNCIDKDIKKVKKYCEIDIEFTGMELKKAISYLKLSIEVNKDAVKKAEECLNRLVNLCDCLEIQKEFYKNE